jgi:Uncharacterized conserved protein
MDRAKMNEIVKRQEKAAVFGSFDAEDACRVGSAIAENMKKQGKALAISVFIDDFEVYRRCMPGTDSGNIWWMSRKYKTVKRTRHSSLGATLLAEQGELEKAAWMDDNNYVLCGGGFPIIIDGEVRAVILASNLVDTEDHQAIVDGLNEVYGLNLPSVLDSGASN